MRSLSFFYSLLLASLVILLNVSSVLAVPALPSSFYGTVKIGTDNLPEGTLARALVDGKVCAESPLQIYQGNSVYSLNVAGDDSTTPEKDCAIDGDLIQFEVGGVLAEQTGTWHSGTNTQLNLSLPAFTLLDAPLPDAVPLPTQTQLSPGQSQVVLPQLHQDTTPNSFSASNPALTNPLVWLAVGLVIVFAGGIFWFLRQRK